MKQLLCMMTLTIFLISTGYSATSEEIQITPRIDSSKSQPETKPQPSQDKKTSSNPKTNIPADYNLTVKSLDGNYVRLSDYKGKVIFLDFWATWCPPCREEMPGIQSLYNKTKNNDVVFICASQENAYKVWNYVKENGYTFPVHTYDGRVPKVYEHTGIPTTFIISKDGRIVEKRVGGYNWDQPYFIDLINRLLEEKS